MKKKFNLKFSTFFRFFKKNVTFYANFSSLIASNLSYINATAKWSIASNECVEPALCPILDPREQTVEKLDFKWGKKCPDIPAILA